MKASTFKAFKKLNKRIDDLTTMIAALVDEGSDKTAAKALAADATNRAASLKAAIPASAGTPTP